MPDQVQRFQWTHFQQPACALAFWAAGERCLAATSEGLWQFDVAGGAWQPIAPAIRHVRLHAVAAEGDRVIVASESEIACSSDGGESWQLAQIPIRGTVMGLALSPCFAQDGLGFAATARDGVWRTSNGGAAWFAWNHGLLDLGVNALAVSPAFAEDERVFAATDHGVFISENTGQAWRELWLTDATPPFTALACDGERLIVGSDGGGVWIAREPFEPHTALRLLDGEVVNAVLPGLAATSAGLYALAEGSAVPIGEMSDPVCLARLADGSLLVGTVGAGVWWGRPMEMSAGRRLCPC